MDSLIIYPENKEQLTAIKAIMKAMKITFEYKGEHYPEYVMKRLKFPSHRQRRGNSLLIQG